MLSRQNAEYKQIWFDAEISWLLNAQGYSTLPHWPSVPQAPFGGKYYWHQGSVTVLTSPHITRNQNLKLWLCLNQTLSTAFKATRFEQHHGVYHKWNHFWWTQPYFYQPSGGRKNETGRERVQWQRVGRSKSSVPNRKWETIGHYLHSDVGHIRHGFWTELADWSTFWVKWSP